MQQTQKTDRWNILLLALSLGLAIWLPFPLFLFSYVVLGPLHYLTELNWLKKKSYFVSNQGEQIPFLFIVFAVCFPPVMALMGPHLHIPWLETAAAFLSKYRYLFFLWGLMLAAGFLGLPNGPIRANWLSISLVIVYVIHVADLNALTQIVVFVPTLIHVYLFTFLFMLYGQLKTKQAEGWLAIIFLAMVPLFIFLIPDSLFAQFKAFPTALPDIGLDGLAPSVFTFLTGEKPGKNPGPLFNKIQIFIAFAYTYHYLNWFSKTNVIGWGRQLSRYKILIILVFWMLAVGSYMVKSDFGLALLFFLSTLHVVMEFPLNSLTIRELLMKLKSSA